MTHKLSLKDVAELVGIAAVVVSLVFLIIEVRDNSRALEQQSALARAEAITAPYFESDLAAVLAKVIAVDGDFGLTGRMQERYGLTTEEAILWERHLWQVWETMQASYVAQGDTADLEQQVSLMLLSPANQQYLSNARRYQFTAEFRAYVERLERDLPDFVEALERDAQ